VRREISTLWYRAPELVMGATRYCPKIDEWSVGCIMLEMLVGLCVFPGNAKRVCDCNKASHINYNEDQLSKIFKLLGTPTGPPLPLPPVQSGRVSSLPPYRSGMSRPFPRTNWTRLAGDTDRQEAPGEDGVHGAL